MESLDEHFLCNIFRIGAVLHNADGCVINEVLIGFHQKPECGLIARLQAYYQLIFFQENYLIGR